MSTDTAPTDLGTDGETGVEAASVASDDRAARSAFTRACAIGGGIGFLVFLWMLTRGTFDLFQWQRVGDFYDAQAHSLLGGHLSVNGLRLGVEAFTVDGNAYIYQGPVPALMRLPIVALAGNAFDGRLTQLSMLCAFVVGIVFACRLHWRVRTVVRGAVPLDRFEQVFTALFTFVLAGGSILVYEASRAWVYHEALLWGLAFALASIDRLLAFIHEPRWRTLAFCAGFASCSLLTRGSIGVGPVIGLGLLFAGVAACSLRDRGSGHHDRWRWLTWLGPSTDRRSARSMLLPVLAAVVVPLALYAAVNYAKFDRLFSIPFETQQFSVIDPGRQAFLEENGGTLFGAKFIPSTVVQYLRPDAVRPSGVFPFLDFAPFPGVNIGDLRWDLFDRSSSLPTSMPFLFFPAVGGLVYLFRPRSWAKDSKLGVLRVPTLAAAGAAAAVIPFGYIANRYLADFLPLLLMGAAIGVQVLLMRRGAAPRPWWVRPSFVTLVVLAVFGTWVNAGLAVRYQRQWSYNLDPDVTAGFLGFQRDVNDALGREPISVEQLDSLPNGVGKPGRLVVIGDCEGLYISDGMETNAVKTTPWTPVERSREGGHLSLDVTFPERPVGTRVPIFTTGPPNAPNVLLAEYRPDDEILFEYRQADPPFTRRYLPFPIEHDKQYRLDIGADWRTDLLTVALDDRVVLDSFYGHRGDDFRIGRNPDVADVEARFPGQIEERPTGTPLCRALVRDAESAARTRGSDRPQ